MLTLTAAIVSMTLLTLVVHATKKPKAPACGGSFS
jgi:hypothetical protein